MKRGIQTESVTADSAVNNGYDISVKVKKDKDGKITDGLIIGDVTYQNQAFVMVAHKGEIKEQPDMGVGISDMCNDHNFDLWKRTITEELEKDGQRISKLNITESGLELEAQYK